MESQAEGIAEIFGVDEQLKEMYDSFEKEDKAKQEEYEMLKEEISKINAYLDSYSIPRQKGDKLLSVIERLSIYMEKAA